MGNGFQVDLGELGRLTTTLDQAADDMREANDKLRDTAASDLGSRAIDGAGRAFQDRWEYGIGKIAEASDQLVEALRSTQRLYAETDRAIAEMFPNPGPGHQGPTDCGWGNAMPHASQDLPAGDSAITQALSGP